MNTIITVTALVGTACLGLTACAGGDAADADDAQDIDGSGGELVVTPQGDEAPAGDAGATDEELALAFAECMRSEGVDWPDPVVNADGSIDLLGGQRRAQDLLGDDRQPDPAIREAGATCGPLLEGTSLLPGSDGIDPETQDQFVEFARCLRDQGIDVDDPDFDGQPGNGDAGGFLGGDFDPEDPATADAIATCRVLFAGGTPGGS